MKRADGRKPNELRPIKITRDYLKHPEGSVLIELGDTKVICTASIAEGVPMFKKGSGEGWVTAEYGMLPRATHDRTNRETGKIRGRTHEIQRLIGRSLRAITDVKKLGERTINIDCDVIQADGGTRTASITGGFVGLQLAVFHLKSRGILTGNVLKGAVAAVSVGIVEGVPILDLNYVEDSAAEVDMNIVMTADGKFVEVQGTAEGEPFTDEKMKEMIELGKKGIGELIAAQKGVLK